jgi:hypothetical protein
VDHRVEGLVRFEVAPGKYDKLHQLAQFAETMPSPELRHVVVSEEEKIFGLAFTLLNLLNGIDGIGDSAAPDFAPVQGESRFSLDGGAKVLQGQKLFCRVRATQQLRGQGSNVRDESDRTFLHRCRSFSRSKHPLD